MRLETDASLIGANTLRLGNPEMLGPGREVLENRIRAIITDSCNILIDDKRIFMEGRGPCPVIFTDFARVNGLKQRLADKAMVLGLERGPVGLSITGAISALAKLGAKSVLIEGGGGLNYSALYEGVVDEVRLTITPRLSGERGAPSLADGPVPLGRPFLDMELLEARTAGTGEVFVRYKIKKR